MIISRTPYRISFFGGATDYPIWYRENGGVVLSTSIDKYAWFIVRYLPPFEEETEDFRVYTVTHKFSPDFHVKHDFTKCLATPLVIPILQDGNAYLCVDRKMERPYKLGSCYPDPESILSWWGSDYHRDIVKSVDTGLCSRCTWSEYNRQIEEVVLQDGMCLSFP